jgi:hypothetical protein
MADLGWYPDPSGRHEQRFFDGVRWTDHVSDGNVPGIDPIPRGDTPRLHRPAVANAPDASAAHRPRWYRRPRWLIAGGAVALIGIGAATSGGGADDPDRVETQPATATTIVPPDTTAAPATSPATTTTTAAPTTLPPPTTTVVVAPPPTPLAPPPTFAAAPAATPAPANCHPSYRPCVPIVSDVDCRGGSGNGPEYTGRVEVIGPDEYDLDRDGDGIGCE